MFGEKKIVKNFPRISRARLRVVDTESAETGDGSTAAPTVEEKEWLNLMRSTAPELEKTRKKISVCALAEIIEYSPDYVEFEYDQIKYKINKPNNSLRIARARENSITAAVEELNLQRCIISGGVPIPKDFSGVDSDVIQLISSVSESFFFTPYL
jgi:hypothetical protein